MKSVYMAQGQGIGRPEPWGRAGEIAARSCFCFILYKLNSSLKK